MTDSPRDHGGERVPIVRVARQRLHMRHEPPAPTALQRGGDRGPSPMSEVGAGLSGATLVWDMPRDGPPITSAGEHRVYVVASSTKLAWLRRFVG